MILKVLRWRRLFGQGGRLLVNKHIDKIYMIFSAQQTSLGNNYHNDQSMLSPWLRVKKTYFWRTYIFRANNIAGKSNVFLFFFATKVFKPPISHPYFLFIPLMFKDEKNWISQPQWHLLSYLCHCLSENWLCRRWCVFAGWKSVK